MKKPTFENFGMFEKCAMHAYTVPSINVTSSLNFVCYGWYIHVYRQRFANYARPPFIEANRKAK